jgi:hypothetical protein
MSLTQIVSVGLAQFADTLIGYINRGAVYDEFHPSLMKIPRRLPR